MKKKLAIAEGLFSDLTDDAVLLGSRCQSCGIAEFPHKLSCPACGSEDVVIEELPRKGKLWSWTIQRFMPKTPYHTDETAETFRPYGVGYVELPGAVCVESRLIENTPEQLRIGMDMELVFETLRHDSDGNEVINFAFRAV